MKEERMRFVSTLIFGVILGIFIGIYMSEESVARDMGICLPSKKSIRTKEGLCLGPLID